MSIWRKHSTKNNILARMFWMKIELVRIIKKAKKMRKGEIKNIPS